jgi:hypothetical protein
MPISPNRTVQYLLVGLLLIARSVRSVRSEDCDNEYLPPTVEPDDIAYFFENGNLDGLHWSLVNVFQRSSRNPDIDKPYTISQVVARGGGSDYTTEYKLRHDLEQARYLAETLDDKDKAAFFRDNVCPVYEQLLGRIPSLDQLRQTAGLYGFQPQADLEETKIAEYYNKALHEANIDRLLDYSGNPTAILSENLDVEAIQSQWDGSDASLTQAGIVVVDNVLSEPALDAIRKILWESTVWYQTKLPLQFGGYVGAYIDDGLHDRILLQLAMDLSTRFPRIFALHPLRYMWAYKYDSNYTGTNLHADQAAINVNLWVTPDEANLDPTSGGLIVYTAKPQAAMDFAAYNTNTQTIREQLLAPSGFSNVTIPYKANRVVIFDSALFHQTDKFTFRSGYTNRRINLTFLYGTMQLGTAKGSADDRTEL